MGREIESFIIRGHHLSHYQLAYYEGPRNSASVIRGIIQEDNNSYSVDVLGKNPGNLEDGLTETYERFKGLPHDHPVKITEGPDDMCKSCAVGIHCLNDQYDIFWLDDFRKVVKMLSLDSPLIEKIGHFYTLTTTAGAIRTVFEQFWVSSIQAARES